MVLDLNGVDYGTEAINMAVWEPLKNRLMDELSNGFTLARFGNEIGISEEVITMWLKKDRWLWIPRRAGEPCQAERIERGLTARFEEIDIERTDAKKRHPGFVETSVTKTVLDAFNTAREMAVMVDIAIQPGAGKTSALREYLARCRKEEGFECPIWQVSLSEWGLTPRNVLCQISESLRRSDDSFPPTGDEFAISRWISETTEGRGGLLIVDEAQHLADAKLDHGVRILNGLRTFVDRGLFGIALLNNGEIYRRLAAGKQSHAQLLSRMASWRVASKGVTEHDVDLVMAAWGVTGRAERDWCVKVGTGPGQLRAIVEAFRRSNDRYGLIDIATLTDGRGG
ncbi:TniB family NTP-binding protein [Chitinimonas naiadis]